MLRALAAFLFVVVTPASAFPQERLVLLKPKPEGGGIFRIDGRSAPVIFKRQGSLERRVEQIYNVHELNEVFMKLARGHNAGFVPASRWAVSGPHGTGLEQDLVAMQSPFDLARARNGTHRPTFEQINRVLHDHLPEAHAWFAFQDLLGNADPSIANMGIRDGSGELILFDLGSAGHGQPVLADVGSPSGGHGYILPDAPGRVQPWVHKLDEATPDMQRLVLEIADSTPAHEARIMGLDGREFPLRGTGSEMAERIVERARHLRASGNGFRRVVGIGKHIPFVGLGFLALAYGPAAYAGEPVDKVALASDSIRTVVTPADIAGSIAEILYGRAVLLYAAAIDSHYGTNAATESVFDADPALRFECEHWLRVRREALEFERRRAAGQTGWLEMPSLALEVVP